MRGLLMVRDPVLQDYLKEDLTDSENKELAQQRQVCTSETRPTSRPLEQIRSGAKRESIHLTTKLRVPTLATCFDVPVWARGR